jgi:hypothetical protein
VNPVSRIAEDMDKEEGKDILAKQLEVYRKRSYKDLLYLPNTQDTMEVTGRPEGMRSILYMIK